MMLLQGVHAQTITISDKSTLRPIEGVVLTSATPAASVTTDQAGEVDIAPLNGSTAITLSHVSYATLTLTYADLAAELKVALDARTYFLNEFVFSASRTREPRRDVPEQITLIKSRDISFLDQPSTADLLQNSGALFVQKSQLGGGSPVIRGFEANRVLLVVDGVRMNNAIYRAGHLQDVITVDQNALDRVEIISGPGSVMYGSDAIGGVIHMMTRTPAFSSAEGTSVGGEAFFRTSTAASEMTAHLGLELRGHKLASYTSITASDFGDLRQGSTRNPFYEDFGRRPFYVEREGDEDVVKENDDSNVQVGTAYKQLDVLEKLRLKTGDHMIHQLNFQLSMSSDVPRYDRLSEYSLDSTGAYVPAQAEWYYGPQKRMLLAYTLELERATGFFNKARITPSYQHMDQSRHSRGFGSSRLGNNIEEVAVIGVNADLEKRFGKNELRYGLEYTNNDVQSEAFREHVETGEITYRTTRYPGGGSSMSSIAAYVSHTLEANEHWVVSEGVRFTSVGLESTFNDTTDFQFLNGTHTQSNSAFSWRLGAMYMPGRDWRFNVLGSTGFRAPNVDDMGKVFESSPGQVIVPNPDLKPETSTNVELGISKTFQKEVTVEVVGFYSLLKDALAVDDFTVNGEDTIDYDDTPSKVTALVNKNEAYVYGASANFIGQMGEHFTLTSGLTYTYGRIKTDTTDYPLDHVPPVYGRTGLELHGKRLRTEVYVVYNGWKRLGDFNLLGEDNEIYATSEGMPAWYTLNVRASVAITSNVMLQAALENINDMNYRVFASGVSGPGRNFSISLRATF